ncbi:MAG TPA: hypothetical protein VHY35_13910 [Stellaceae bacterium]|jgi:hypothetical protein|nr:hypothetical protein [Stellaceae bacterium]
MKKLRKRRSTVAVALRLVATIVLELVAVPALGGTSAVSEAKLPLIWLSSPPVADYMTLFRDPASWKTGLAHTGVLELSTHFASTTGDKALREIIVFLQSHHMALAIDGNLQTPGKDECGLGIEGYANPGEAKSLAARIKSLGGELRYITMDEPLWFGHIAKSYWRPNRGVCRDTVEAVATNVAAVLSEVRQIFPDVEIGDIEYLPPSDAAEWPRYSVDLKSWLSVFAKKTGRPMSFLHFDVGWQPIARHGGEVDEAWRNSLKSAAQIASNERIPYGVVYNGSPTDEDDDAWVARAEQRFRIVEGALQLKPEHVVIQSWMKHPVAVTSEGTSGTLTNLLLRYLQWKEPGVAAPN